MSLPGSPSVRLDLASSPPLPPSSFRPSAPPSPSSKHLPAPPRPSPKLPPLPPNGGSPSPPVAYQPRLGGSSGLLTPTLASTSSSAPPTPKPPPPVSSLPLAPLPHHLAPYLSPLSPLTPPEKRALLTHTYLRASSSGNSDLLEWLLALPTDPTLSSTANAAAARRRLSLASLNSDLQALEEEMEELGDEVPRKWVQLEARDEEGNTALGLCTALGHAEGVRVLVEAGVDIEAGDRAGWTPLHWAVQTNDIPIASYLLNHRASPLSCSNKGLTPRDLVKRGDEGLAMREVLKSAYEAAVERERMLLGEEEGYSDDEGEGAGSRPASRASAVSSLMTPAWAHDPAKVEEEQREREKMKRMELAADSARCLEVDLGVLGWGGRGTEPAEDPSSSDDGIPNPFIWTPCLPDQMLVFSLDDLPIFFDVVITTMKPVRPRQFRTIPANVVFLCARYAHYHATPELLEELVVGAMERIEAAVHNRPDDMTNCSFWLSNCLLLLYYLRKEPNLHLSTREMQVHLCDLINEIFVFVIRDAERRIDRVLEPAILEHEALPGFEDVAFEGEWSSNRFVKKLTGGRGKKAAGGGGARSVSAMGLFGGGSGGGGGGDGVGGVGGEGVNAAGGGEITPRSVTSLLSSTLFVLQSYEIPPSIVVQAFSQLFYWIACEVFNRLLTQRKYLCRSKAMQIRLNASNLEDWARSNRMPTKMISVHFAPLNQLLQWLQCLSSEASIDGLIGTIQSLRSLNPLQLRRAVREYRYEVDETRMDEDCSQYLLQIQKQWERMRLQKTVDGLGGEGKSNGGGEVMSRGSSGSASSETSEERREHESVTRMIDEVFADPSAFGSYTPPGGSEALGELLNSRYMLPFAVPSSAEMLLNFHQTDAFGPFASTTSAYARTSSGGTLTPSHSTTSLSSTYHAGSRRPSLAPSLGAASASAQRRSSVASAMSDATTPDKEKEFVPVLPDSFWTIMDEARYRARVQAAKEAAAPATPEERIRNWVQGQGQGLGLGNVGGNESLPSTPMMGEGAGPAGGVEGTWFDWRKNMPGDEEEDEEADDEDGSESGSDLPEAGDSSFEVQETPKPRSGAFEGAGF
ncbi:hypothetical protein BCR35DRAFT_284790 [Leucosporidium creatinivorum]|uniref:Dilute domain-containing protein n=1 Tax=Leucosporidium creatinivorum TaxID=106004 RepID=A0A1Y2D416_9BASI|nr:hypothetical protein BCR35DRAFT_284790 [Leucosporidium creatinivorum]